MQSPAAYQLNAVRHGQYAPLFPDERWRTRVGEARDGGYLQSEHGLCIFLIK